MGAAVGSGPGGAGHRGGTGGSLTAVPEADHYFSPVPSGPTRRRTLRVDLAGRSVTVQTAGGVFSSERLDPGTAALLRQTPDPPREGALLDLGCGWGPVALSLALRSPDADVYAVDVNERALALLRENAASLGLHRIHGVTPDAVPARLRFAAIWSNPPIRIGKARLYELLRSWLPRLAPDGTAYLVVAKDLGADSLARWLTADLGMPCRRLATTKGYRVLAVHHG